MEKYFLRIYRRKEPILDNMYLSQKLKEKLI